MGADWGSAFGPIKPPEPSAEEQLAAQLKMLQSSMDALNNGIAEVAVSDDGGARAKLVRPGIDSKVLAVEIAQAMGAAVNTALARFAALDRGEATSAALVEALREQTQRIQSLGRKISALSVMPSGGASGHVIVDSGNISLTGGPHDVRDLNGIGDRDDEAGAPTLVGLTKAIQVIATDLRTEARRRPVHKVATGLVTVPGAGAYVTVVEFTPAVPVVISGYNADFQSIATANYRMRLITGDDAAPAVQHGEEVSTTANSWQPLHLDVGAGTRVAVQVVHDQLTAQSVRGTVNYYEEP